MNRFSGIFAKVILPAVLFSGCRPEKSIPLEVPENWTEDGPRWWRLDTDTSGVFRNLETLSAMGIAVSPTSDPMFGPGRTNRDLIGRANRDLPRRRLVAHVKNSLIPLFRNRPQVVDSLFERFVVPEMASARLEGDVRPVIMTFKRDGYRIISRHFREPYTLTRLGIDIPLRIPDSLREQSIVGHVFMQVYISEDGDPVAIEKLEGVHPVLDRIAMRATTKMRWQPAYLLKGGSSRPLPSWARFKVNFSTAR